MADDGRCPKCRSKDVLVDEQDDPVHGRSTVIACRNCEWMEMREGWSLKGARDA